MIWTAVEWVSVGLLTMSKINIGQRKWFGWGIAVVGYVLAAIKFASVGFYGFTGYTIFMAGLSVWYGLKWYKEHNGW